ncbi:MAG: hypothetical protein WAU42_04075 [Solirubrobacteraceae bacterium]
MSQRQLTQEIRLRFPDAPASVPTIKKVEAGDLSVGGSLREWAVWVGDSTQTPYWFLEGGWDAPRGRYWQAEEYVKAQQTTETMTALVDALRERRSAESTPDIEDLLVIIKRMGIKVGESDSLDLLLGRLEERTKVEQRRARLIMEKWRAIERDRDAIHRRDSSESRQHLLAQISAAEGHELTASELATRHSDDWEAEMERLTDVVENNLEAIRARTSPVIAHTSLKRLTQLLAQRDRVQIEIDAKLTASEKALQTTIEAELLEQSRNKPLRITFPDDGKLDLFWRYLDDEKLSSAETTKLKQQLRDSGVGSYLKVIAERYALEMPQDTALVTHEFGLVETTPQRANDAPLPEPPGELGRRAREHLPTTGGREQQPTPEEPDAQRGTGQ